MGTTSFWTLPPPLMDASLLAALQQYGCRHQTLSVVRQWVWVDAHI